MLLPQIDIWKPNAHTPLEKMMTDRVFVSCQNQRITLSKCFIFLGRKFDTLCVIFAWNLEPTYQHTIGKTWLDQVQTFAIYWKKCFEHEMISDRDWKTYLEYVSRYRDQNGTCICGDMRVTHRTKSGNHMKLLSIKSQIYPFPLLGWPLDVYAEVSGHGWTCWSVSPRANFRLRFAQYWKKWRASISKDFYLFSWLELIRPHSRGLSLSISVFVNNSQYNINPDRTC